MLSSNTITELQRVTTSINVIIQIVNNKKTNREEYVNDFIYNTITDTIVALENIREDLS